MGKYQDHPPLYKPLPIIKPSHSEKLAEFVGIILGDGGLTPNQLKITLHRVDDLPYSHFVANLIEGLFGVCLDNNTRSSSMVLDLSVSRVELVKFCLDMGLRTGSKVIDGMVHMTSELKPLKTLRDISIL